MTTQSTQPALRALTNEIEAGIGEIVSTKTNTQPPRVVYENVDANDVGRLSAEALATEYQKTAESIESMATALREMNKRCAEAALRAVREYEQLVTYINEVNVECQETGEVYSQRAGEVFKHIHDASTLASDVRKMCADLRAKITNGNGNGKPEGSEKQ